MNYFYLYK